MKVIRMKRGYRITISDREYEALTILHVIASLEIAQDPIGTTSFMPAKMKSAIRRGRLGCYGAFDVDEDRRKEG